MRWLNPPYILRVGGVLFGAVAIVNQNPNDLKYTYTRMQYRMRSPVHSARERQWASDIRHDQF